MEYGKPRTSRNPPQPPGMLLQFVKGCNFGNKDDIKEVPHYIAVHLIEKGIATVVPDMAYAHYRPNGTVPPVDPRKMRSAPGPVTGLVTAICPTFNRRNYIPTTIALFLRQTYQKSELLIVDDSYESVQDLIPQHPRVRYIRLEKTEEHPEWYGHDGRMLIGAKRNICLENARGEFIVHWDDDDWQAPGRIADQVTALTTWNKQVLTYCNILYWNEDKQFACRCFPRKEMRALHGATFCYRKSFWLEHQFKVCGGGEDTEFGAYANSRGQLLVTDAREHMVVRAHGHDDSVKDARGNTCRTADHMGTPASPKVNKDQIPQEFFAPLLTAVPFPKPAPTDAVIGVIKNYDWPAIRAYAVSLNRSGFSGTKLMFVENIKPAARQGLLDNGFTIVDFVTPPAVLAEEQKDYLTFGRHRFKYAIDYLKAFPGKFRNIVWCDVRDQVFQSDPSAWLERNLFPDRIIAAGEGWLVKNESYNNRWAKVVSPDLYSTLCELDICCSGTFAGDAEAMLGVFESIYALVLASRFAPTTQPHAHALSDNADQAMLNRVIRTLPYKEVTRVPRMSEGFCATWFPSKSNDPSLIPNYGFPVFSSDGIVYTPETHKPFCMVHQFDRDPQWRASMDKKYQ